MGSVRPGSVIHTATAPISLCFCLKASIETRTSVDARYVIRFFVHLAPRIADTHEEWNARATASPD
jgi:hypothetical protein